MGDKDKHADWDQLVSALREELQEKGDLVRLLNQQTELLYRRDAAENSGIEEQIKNQTRVTSRLTHVRELILKETAVRKNLEPDAAIPVMLQLFPEYVHPLLEALFAEVNHLSSRLEERLRQNQQLKFRLLPEAITTT